MKKNITIAWVLLVALAMFPQLLSAQATKPFVGTITYDVNVSGNIPPEYRSMLPNTAVYQINEQFARIDMTPSMMGAGSVIMNHEKQTMRMLLEMPGSKFQLIMDDQLKEQAAGTKNITYINESKKIAGYDCKKAVVDPGDGQTTEVWYSDKIKVKNLDKMWGDLKGFPLEFSTVNQAQGVSMLYVAKSVAPGKVDKKIFDIPADYKPISEGELMQLLQGMMD